MDKDRRKFLKLVARTGALTCLGGSVFALRSGNATPKPNALIWQIDPLKCIACGRCENKCVLNVSAVKCYHNHKMCGYCRMCTGYFIPDPIAQNSGAENQLCPTAAIRRTFIEDPYFEYVIDKDLCIGCGKCVEGCTNYGNGSLFLQIDQTLCVQCNQCSIAIHCPAQAIQRVPGHIPYQLKLSDPDEEIKSS